MILVARDPVARLKSAFYGYFHYFSKYGKNNTGFTAYVKEQVGAFQTCAAQFGASHCAFLFEALSAREEAIYFHADQLMRGMYGLFLEVWFRFIPPANWMIVHSDDFFSNPKETLSKVVDFLGLSKVNETVLETMAKAGNVNSYAKDYPPIEPEAKRLLQELYRPYNTLLAQLTGDPRYEQWNQL
ncbi:hypothetical protein GPECTOR_11g157 [Gonium pectorale]|uniref:Sulfotransferase n=1 Tax=Gonium pectorale TaxID=33097 RepID=A0A150GPQ0_GONPE|nr:hypothetical protein GPECTOR_11g157 [Gonium pectorale]|eukprot:KXZ51708.1 hypothetical protein GPECTOR_11g157 [Gonium pectorale]